MEPGQKISLPQPSAGGTMSLEEAIAKRRSVRSFLDKELSLPVISQLLWAGQGITAERGGVSLRAAPSAGALYPFEIYVVKSDGAFRYAPVTHSLTILRTGDLRPSLTAASRGQESIAQAPLTFVLCAVYERITGKYGQRGERYVLIETGHIAENIHLQAVALGLGSVPIGSFRDQEIRKILSLPDGEEPLYLIPVGYPR